MQITNLIVQLVIGLCTLLGLLGALFRLLRRLDRLSDLPENIARMEKKLGRIEQWQNDHINREHNRWRR
jgi:hypothetical protein